jgi:predicted small metal-binding protein
MLVVHCACGTDVSGETEDEVVEAVQAHVRSDHPELVEEFTREKILSIAHQH